MAELTVNPNEVQEGLSEQEQEHLAIGERMAQEQDTLLAGKYQSAAELEKAYLELQKQFSKGSKGTDDSVEETGGSDDETDETDDEEDGPDVEFLNELWEQAVSGNYTQETIDKINEMDGKSVAEMYLQYRDQVEKQQAPTLTEESAAQLKQMVGGDTQYQSMMEWANDNLKQEEISMYDAVMESGNALAAYWAVQAMAYRYGDSVGREGKLVTGRGGADAKDVFRSQAEVNRAMKDPRYDSDPAYRQDVFDKLSRSNIDY